MCFAGCRLCMYTGQKKKYIKTPTWAFPSLNLRVITKLSCIHELVVFLRFFAKLKVKFATFIKEVITLEMDEGEL